RDGAVYRRCAGAPYWLKFKRSVRSIFKPYELRIGSKSNNLEAEMMTLNRVVRPILGSMTALFVLAFSHVLIGQAVNGTLLGTVTDPSGAVVPNATVTVILTGQSVQHTTVTNGSGDFTVPDLPSGT